MHETPHAALAGQPVEVRTRFEGRWSHGFRVVGMDEGGYLVERVCDGCVLAGRFAPGDLRPVHPDTVTPLPVVPHRSSA